MDLLKKYKSIIIVVVVIVVGFVVWNFFFASNDSGEDLIVSTNVSVDAPGSVLVALLSKLQSLSLDDTLFADDRFEGLVDFTVPIAPQPVGRINPFAPLR